MGREFSLHDWLGRLMILFDIREDNLLHVIFYNHWSYNEGLQNVLIMYLEPIYFLVL